MIINKGQFMTFAEGEYSDYCVAGLVVALVEFDIKEKQKEWETEHTSFDEVDCLYRNRKMRRVTGTNFLPWLVSKGLVDDVDYIEVHTGSYGVVDISISSED